MWPDCSLSWGSRVHLLPGFWDFCRLSVFLDSRALLSPEPKVQWFQCLWALSSLTLTCGDTDHPAKTIYHLEKPEQTFFIEILHLVLSPKSPLPYMVTSWWNPGIGSRHLGRGFILPATALVSKRGAALWRIPWGAGLEIRLVRYRQGKVRRKELWVTRDWKAAIGLGRVCRKMSDNWS